MSAPASFDRVLAAVSRFFPFDLRLTRPGGDTPPTTDGKIDREIGTIAWVFAHVADLFDDMWDELFPDTAVQSIKRWEKITHVASIESDDIDVRRQRVLSVIRKNGGIRIDQLSKALAGPLQRAAEALEWYETLRAQIEPAMTKDLGMDDPLEIPTSGDPLVVRFDVPWPGNVDEAGVRIEVILSTTGGTATYALSHEDGTSIALTPDGDHFTIEEREAFLGKPAAGPWYLSMVDTGGIELEDATLLVSNDVDAQQIYNFHVYCPPDPILIIQPARDWEQANRVLSRSALAHMNGRVVQSTGFIVGTTACVVGREPVGEP